MQNQLGKLAEAPPALLAAWHWLTTVENGAGFDLVFSTVRRDARPTWEEARVAIQQRLEGQVCQLKAQSIVEVAGEQHWPLAYVLAWLSVAGTNSVMPPWVLFQFPEASRILKTASRHPVAHQPDCQWCQERNDPHPGANPVVRLRKIPARARRPRRNSPAGKDSSEGNAGREPACDTAHRRREVHLLPGASSLSVRQDGQSPPLSSHPWWRSWLTRWPTWRSRRSVPASP